MKHAGTEALNRLEPLLAKLREFDGLTERKRGVFYLKSSAFIHFHEDPTGLYAHFKEGPNWRRLPVNTRGERSELIAKVRELIRLDQRHLARDALEAELLRGRASGPPEKITARDWSEIRRAVSKRGSSRKRW